MRRGAFLLTAIALAATTAPARAAAPSTVVYEVRRLRSDANHSAEVVVESTGDVPALLVVFRPAEDEGYTWQSIVMVSGGMTTERVKISKGERVLVYGERGHVSVRIRNDRRWGVSTTNLAYRLVQEPAAGATDRFESAKVAGGRYGSLLFAKAPCGRGTWSLHLDGESGATNVCGVDGEEVMEQTTSGAAWVMEGTVLMPSSGDYRFQLLEMPRRV